MNEAIFVLNAGSSSLKFSVYGLADEDLSVAAHGEIEGLGTSAHFKAKDDRGQTLADVSLGDPTRSVGHAEAFAHLAHWAYEHFADELVPLAVGHRVVHGGLTFKEPTLIDAAVMTTLEQLIPLAPLHQPHNLEVIKAVMRLWPDLPQVACFDTVTFRIVTEPRHIGPIPDRAIIGAENQQCVPCHVGLFQCLEHTANFRIHHRGKIAIHSSAASVSGCLLHGENRRHCHIA